MGVVELPYRAGGEITVRVTNVTEEPVESIWASYDVILVHHPHAVYRGGLINNLVLGPGESREFSFRRTDSHFYESDGTPIKPEGKIWSHWLDVRLYVTYRDRDGFIQQIVRKLSLEH